MNHIAKPNRVRLRQTLMGAGRLLIAVILFESGQADESLHWAFQPIATPPPPPTADRRWARNPIDQFVLSKLEQHGWSAGTHAPWPALLRRVHLDLTGFPPTPEEQSTFLFEPSDAKLDQVIEELLCRPTYGERWGRHWLDVARYAESNGYERDATKPFVWRYRDYVIDAFNRDKPIDRFIVEQLAGDELPDASAESLVATGFLRLGHWDDEPADPATDRFDQLDDIVSTTSSAFLGITLGCARCHDHKFDPFPTRDYYSMVAIFNPLQRPRNGRTELALPVGTPEQIAEEQDRNAQMAQLTERIESLKKAPSQESDSPANQETIAILQGEIEALRHKKPDLPRGYFMQEPASPPPATHVLLRGNPGNRGDEVFPAVPSVLTRKQPDFEVSAEHSSGRRLALARWIASPRNPLTARVWVNRIWQQHFAAGLVRTPNDFGTLGTKPTHPELLDWLAHWFVHEGEWSLKRLHQLILSSNTYRVGRNLDPDRSAQDPDNLLLWRMPYRRLEVEAIRDSMLSVSGQLNRLMRGPSMYPSVSRQALEGHSDPNQVWEPFDERSASRRTVYAFVKRSLIVPMLEVLDLCETTQSASQRMVTTIAPQALTLFNGDFANRQAHHLARRLVREGGQTAEARIDLAYRLALCRPPSPSEKAAMLKFLADAADTREDGDTSKSTSTQDSSEHAGLTQMCRVLFNLNEFVYPD
ncbi:MAG: DUF1549 and DUF1553 domain-containing protein [Verrucomicrobia bacterium]|nr:DUF1549 and DUF1553 domain-containing protein [Verrucomicrobiota bacterium]